MEKEVRKQIMERDLWQCQRCGAAATEVAHRIAKTRSNAQEVMHLWQRWFLLDITETRAREILDHPENLSASCRLCNDYFNVGHNKSERHDILRKIVVKLSLEGKLDE